MTVFETVTALEPADVLARARQFFASRVPHQAAFPEKEGPNHLVLRGQGGEELVIAAWPGEGGSRVRGSSLLFGQQVKRFMTTLPAVGADDVTSRPLAGAGPV